MKCYANVKKPAKNMRTPHWAILQYGSLHSPSDLHKSTKIFKEEGWGPLVDAPERSDFQIILSTQPQIHMRSWD